MCGWCYGATALLEALSEADNVEVVYHPGGMVPRLAITPSFRKHILNSDEAIARATGVVFGDSYLRRLKSTEALVFDSYITICAILVAEAMGVSPLIMLKAIQAAHYQLGKQVELLDTLADIALMHGLDKSVWQENMQQAESNVTEAVKESHRLMNQYQVQGYPMFIADKVDGPQRLPHRSYYQNVPEWKKIISILN